MGSFTDQIADEESQKAAIDNAIKRYGYLTSDVKNLPKDYKQAVLTISEAFSLHKVITRGRQNELMIELHEREVLKIIKYLLNSFGYTKVFMDYDNEYHIKMLQDYKKNS